MLGASSSLDRNDERSVMSIEHDDESNMERPGLALSPMSSRKPTLIELTYLSRHWHPGENPPRYSFWMASSEVDQKILGIFARATSVDNNYLSSFLFRVLGLSVLLAEKLLQARKARRLDPIRDPKARHLIHHILWLAREGLVMVEQYVLPMVGNYVELKVLSYKLRASFYHIFVLFHNEPAVNNRIETRSRSGSTGSVGQYSLYPDPLAPKTSTSRAGGRTTSKATSGRQRSPAISVGGGLGGNTTARTPPGLPLPSQFAADTYSAGASQQVNNSGASATYLLPLVDYTPHATAAFKAADAIAESLLPGSHPLRLSVKVEYVAYVYDCLKEYDVSRIMARKTIDQVYDSNAPMDDEAYADAEEMVGMLLRMERRGLGVGRSQSQSQSGGGGSERGNGSISGRAEARRRQNTTWV